jgi:sugar lactone lactonase YvrE
MIINFGCQNARSSTNRLHSFGHSSNKFKMPVVALLAVLCGIGASVEAQTASYSGSTSAFDTTHFTNPQGIATDAAGDVFIANNASPSTVYEFTRTAPGVYSAPVALPNPSLNYVFIRGIVIDSSGNLWVADNANGSGGQVYESVNTAGSFGTPTKVGTGWTAPWGMAADALGNVFVADNGASAVKKISGGTVSTLNTGGISAPRGIALDSSANIFAINGNNFTMMELTAASSYATASTVNSSPFSAPGDIAIDASGNIWVADFGTNAVREMTFASNYQTVMNWGAGLNGPVAVWLDADGNWLVTNYNNNAVDQIATGAVNAGTVAVNSTSASQTLSFTFTGAANTTIEAPVVLTKGATGQDFIDAGTGTCTTTNGTGHPYVPASTCTVNVTLKPKSPGSRKGAVELLNTSGTVLATALIYGTGSGPELVFPGSTTITTLGSGFSLPLGLALDGSNNVFVADTVNNAVKEIVAAGGYTTVTARGTGFSSPKGVAVDGAGNVFVADSGNNAVKEIVAAGGYTTVTTLGTGFTFNGPTGVAVDGSGNVYVADNGDSSVYEMSPGCSSAGCVTTLGSAGGFGSAAGAAVDANGNVYVTGSGSVKKMTPGCTSGACVTSLGGGFNTPIGVAVDGAGNVYVGDFGSNLVDEMPAGCASSTCVTTLGSGFSAPAGVALDGNGNLYIADRGNSLVKTLSLTTPPSLSFATTNMGSESSDSPKMVALRNIGNAGLTFPVPGTGENPSVSASFTLDGSTTCPEVLSSGSAGTLAAGANCEVAVDFIPAAAGPITGSVVLTDNNLNATPAVTQSIGLSGSGATAIVPYIQVNGGAWQQVASVTVNAGDTVNLGPQPQGSGTWSWTGPNGFTSTSRALNSIALPSATNVYTATYTNTGGINSTQAFTITVNSTPIVPYLQVNGGAWQQASTVTVNPGDTVNLAPQPASGGTWSWTGPNSFTSTSRVINSVALTSASNVYTATYTNTSGINTNQAFTITLNGTPIVPYLQVNGGSWQQTATVTVNPGDTVTLGPQPQTGGTWSWTGPSSFTSTSRVINATSLPSPSNTYTATYTNTNGVNSTQAFTITVNSTPIVPYLQVNGGSWQQASTVTVNVGDTVALGPQPQTGGTWSWTGPSSFISTSRVINATSLPSPSNTYTATYTNTSGVNSTQAFTITVNPTAITPYSEVNGGAWLQAASFAVNVGDTVNLGPQASGSGTWSWSGPNGFTSTAREIDSVPLPSTSDVYTATYTNASGVNSTQTFTITVNSTPIVPYLQVNGGAWQQASSVTVNVGDTVNLGPQPQSGGTWSWTGPNSFTSTARVLNAIALPSGTNVYTAHYTNVYGVAVTPQSFTITVNPTPITPNSEVNGGAWLQAASFAVNVGDTVNLGPQASGSGTWSWSGPNAFTSTSREIDAIVLNSPSNVYIVTFTNADGVNSTQTYTITINPTPITPYLEVNGGPWQQAASATVNSGDTVNLGPQPQTGGTWSWTGPNGFSSTSRVLNGIPLTTGSNVYTATYTNADGVNSTQTFTITSN